MNKKISVSTAITIAIIAMTVTFSVTMIMARQIFDRTIPSVKEKESMYSKIAEIDKYVRANYYGDISDATLYDMIGYGYILGTGDKNAAYYTARQFSELLDIQSGKIMGIGVDLVKDSSGYARITAVYEGSPAEDLDLQVGGFITAIDGTDAKGMSRDAVIAKLRGEAGTGVTISYMAPDGTTADFSINRKTYIVPSVERKIIDEHYGYIRIYRFDATTLTEFSRAINEMQDAGVKSLVIDLRDNAGGLISAAVDCLDLMVSKGDLVWAEYKDGERKLLGESDDASVSLPLVVMVNKGTASSAELFATTLRTFNGAQLVGEKTMGKGTIQGEPHRMSDGSAVVVTVAEMITSTGESFNGVGLPVDVEIVQKPGTESTEPGVEHDSMVQQAIALARVAAGVPETPPEPTASPESGSEAASQPEEGSENTPESETAPEGETQPEESTEEGQTAENEPAA